MNAHGVCHAVLEHDQIPKGFPCQNSAKWKDVQGQMEWTELKLQEIVGLSQKNKPSHVILGDDS